MKTKNIFLISLVVLIAILYFVVKPSLMKREVTRIVTTVLTSWQTNDMDRTYVYWKNPYKYPPVFSLVSYQIKSKVFDKKNKRRHAQFNVILEFTPGTHLPSGQEWILELSQSHLGWQITDFRLAN